MASWRWHLERRPLIKRRSSVTMLSDLLEILMRRDEDAVVAGRLNMSILTPLNCSTHCSGENNQ